MGRLFDFSVLALSDADADVDPATAGHQRRR
jgi:hypothetical protein